MVIAIYLSIYLVNDQGVSTFILDVEPGESIRKRFPVCDGTSTVSVVASSGEVCGTHTLVCNAIVDDCCDDLDYDVCLAGETSENCLLIEVSLDSECVGVTILHDTEAIDGTATEINPNNPGINFGTVEVCKDPNNPNSNPSIKVIFKTGNCGFFDTGFFYPFRALHTGTLSPCE